MAGFNALSIAPAALDSLLDQSKDCIKVLDLDGRLVFMSANGMNAMEIDDFRAVANRSWREFWPAPSKPKVDNAVLSARSGSSYRFQGFCPTAAGTDKWWDVSVSPLLDQHGNPHQIIATSRDISHKFSDSGREEALRALVKQLQEEKALLAEANAKIGHLEKLRLLGQFAGSIVHDLNNILATMSSASSLLRRRVDSPVAADILNHVDQAVLRGSELTRQLLDFSRNDAGAAEVIDLRSLVEADFALLKHLVGRDVTLTMDCDEDVAPVLAPSSRVRSVLFNLLANSRDAMDAKGEISIRLRNRVVYGRVGQLPAGRYSVIEIQDDGCGMTQEVIAKLGQAFFTTKASGKGTGLGIPSAFELAEMCGGIVEIESTVGQGTTIALVLGSSPAEGRLFENGQVEIDATLHGNATIMVIENDTMLRSHLASSLRALGYSVLEATSASSAVATALTAARIDLLISDLQLDHSCGHEAATALRQIVPEIPVVFLSGSPAMGIPSGELLLRKPVDEAVMAIVILEQLGRLPARRLTQKLLSQSERLKGRLRQPAMIAAYEAWRQSCLDGHRLPSRKVLEPLESILASTSYVVEIAGTIDVPTFRFVKASPQLEQRLDRPLQDRFVTSADDDALGSLGRALARATKGVAHYDFTRFRAGNAKVHFERLLLPLSDNGVDVTHILGVVTIDEHLMMTNHNEGAGDVLVR